MLAGAEGNKLGGLLRQDSIQSRLKSLKEKKEKSDRDDISSDSSA